MLFSMCLQFIKTMEGNNHLFGSFWVEGLTNDKGTVHTKCVRGPAKAFYFWWHWLLELHRYRERKEKGHFKTDWSIFILHKKKSRTVIEMAPYLNCLKEYFKEQERRKANGK